MTYSVVWDPSATNTAVRFLKDDPEGLRLFLDAVDLLADDPRPAGSVPYGAETLRRIHAGRYRALYEIHDDTVTVLVIQVGRTA